MFSILFRMLTYTIPRKAPRIQKTGDPIPRAARHFDYSCVQFKASVRFVVSLDDISGNTAAG
jgi:hypothetical protein